MEKPISRPKSSAALGRIISEIRCENYEECLRSELCAVVGSDFDFEWVAESTNDAN